MTATDRSSPDACLDDAQFEALSQGRLAPDALDVLRAQVQAALDDPDGGIDHDQLWSRMEQRMKRAVARAA